MKELSKKLLAIVQANQPKLDNITDEDWQFRSSLNKWNKKQILGHLIDSAANNHQRFVRVQFEANPVITYNPDKWVNTQNYESAEVNDLIDLWASYNRYLALIISNVPESNYENLCDIKSENPVTLEWLVADYINHLEHHLKQIIP